MTVPSWVQDSIFYQIFPDRFANGNHANDPFNVQPWGTPPDFKGFMGGDLEGVIQKLDYLLDLGVTALYLNPIFEAASNHRYDTKDYFKIDPKLGDLVTFQRLLRLAHSAGLRVILDGVFNHCNRGFFAFSDLMENEEASPYRNWFRVKQFPLNPFGDDEANYECWWNIKSLPKFNTDEPQVRQYLLDVAKYWIDQGVDGWRLDVPNEINDAAFWADFQRTVKAANPYAYTLGEIWEVNPRWVGEQAFDGLMNYPFRTAVLDFFVNDKLTAPHFGDTVEHLLTVYPSPHISAQFNLLGSHDTERILTLCGGDLHRLKLALLFQFTYVGAPSIYYGDEIGLEGGKDPDCRRAFNWQTQEWNMELRDYLKTLIALRKDHPALRRGKFKRLHAHAHSNLYAFLRKSDQVDAESLVIVLNNSDQTVSHDIPTSHTGWANGAVVKDLLSDKKFAVENHLLSMKLSPRSGLLLKAK